MLLRTPPRPSRLAATAALATVATVAGLAGAAPAAVASTGSGVTLNAYEAHLVAAVNDVRRAHGLRPLAVLAGPTDVARDWSWQMARSSHLAHNPALVSQIERHGCADWTTIDENVGDGPANNPQGLFEAYLASPHHRENILDPTAVGIGVGAVQRGNRTWDTLDFVAGCSAVHAAVRPAQSTVLDQRTVGRTAFVARLGHTDPRLSAARSGGVRVTAPRVRHAATRITFSHRSGRAGAGALVLHQALDLHAARTVKIRLSVSDPTHKPVRVSVILGQSFGTRVTVGTVVATPRARWITLRLPAGARTAHNQIELAVRSRSLDAISPRRAQRVATLAVDEVRIQG